MNEGLFRMSVNNLIRPATFHLSFKVLFVISILSEVFCYTRFLNFIILVFGKIAVCGKCF